MTIPMQNFEADTLVILKRRDYDAYGKKFLCEKKVFSRFTFIKKLEIYSYVEFYGGFNGTNHLKRSSLVLSLVDFFRTSKKLQIAYILIYVLSLSIRSKVIQMRNFMAVTTVFTV